MKKIISVSLLIFVAISISFLVYKELSKRGDKVNVMKEAQTQNISPIQNVEPTNKDRITKEINLKSQKGILPSQPTTQTTKKVIAYYFHGTHRCPTCLNIENYSREAIEKYFAKELQDKTLEFKPLNVEEPEIRHYIQDYQLFSKSLIIALYEGDKQTKWKNLTDIWIHVRDKDKFYQYVKDEIESFLKEIK